MRRVFRWAWRWLPPLCFGALILFLSTRPTIPVPMPFGLDKVFHAAAYGCMGLLIVRAREGRMALPGALAWLLLGAAFGAVDEWIQRSTPGRTPAASDWLADVVGFGMALMGGPWVWSRPVLRVLG